MEQLTLFCVITTAFIGVISGSNLGLVESMNASVGETVLFYTSLAPAEAPLDFIIWNMNAKNIVTYFDGSTKPGPAYEGRINLSISTGSLELRNVALSDTGEYSVEIRQTAGSDRQTGVTTVKIYEPVSEPVSITATSTDLVEFNSSVSLSCSPSSGSDLSFLWYKDDVQVSVSDRVHLTDGNATLTISPVLRDDQGSYTCEVSNPISSGITSDKKLLNVSYGPEDVILTRPPPDEYWEDTKVPLSCSADSRPPAHFEWFRNKEMLSYTGPEIDLVLEQSGNYNCRAFNSKTRRYTTSKSTEITVLMKITGIFIKPSDKPVEGTSLNLTCDASGSKFKREWLFNGTELKQNENIVFYDERKILSFKNLTRGDNGNYTCNISNAVSSQSEDYEMKATYGIGKDPTPNTGLIIGIVFGCIGGVLLISGGVFYALKTKKHRPKLNTRTDGEGRDNSAYAQNQEVNYADVRFVKKDGAVVQLGVQNNTEYSEVERNNNPPPAARLPTYNAHMQRSGRPAPEPPTEYAEVRPKRH